MFEKSFIKYWVFLIVISFVLTLLNCKHETTVIINDIEQIQNPFNVELTYNYQHDIDSLSTFSEIGVWMFRSNRIANWLGKKVSGKTIYEPVNVIWIDYSSGQAEEAVDRVSRFLKANRFDTRKGSSTGYFTFFGVQGEMKKTLQYPTNRTWSDKSALVDNHHGRIFTQEAGSGNAFITLGAFSRETGITHNYISFNTARDAMHEREGWILDETDTLIPNSFPDGNHEHFSTGDHDGVRIFVYWSRE